MQQHANRNQVAHDSFITDKNNYILMKKTFLISLACILSGSLFAQQHLSLPTPSSAPGKYQLEQIKRKYGMFIHFSINTFNDVEWSDGTLPPSSYKPTAIDAEQWVKTARDAGMKYVILVAKHHHDGFLFVG
ncbi:alpha-L-fucosidase [Pedobacter sp. NJ-S-72]